MTNSIRTEIQNIIANGAELKIVKTFVLVGNALGGQDWRISDIKIEKGSKKETAEKEYKISAKQLVKINGKTHTVFEIYVSEDRVWKFLSNGKVKSTGVASDKKCLMAYLDGEF